MMITTAYGEKILISSFLSARYYELYRTFHRLFPEWRVGQRQTHLTAVNELLAILCGELRSVIM